MQSLEPYRSSTEESYSGATNSSDDGVTLSQEDHAELARSFVVHSLLSREGRKRKRSGDPKDKGRHDRAKSKFEVNRALESEEYDQCGCEKQRQ